MPNTSGNELEGITLSVYLYVIKKNIPVGPRDTFRGINLSSPSVAYRHLEKLEEMGYLSKNKHGEYLLRKKASVPGYIWLGRQLMSKMLFYSLVFMSILIIELIVLAAHYSVENDIFKIFFLLLTLITGFAMVVFIAEALLQRKRMNQWIKTE